ETDAAQLEGAAQKTDREMREPSRDPCASFWPPPLHDRRWPATLSVSRDGDTAMRENRGCEAGPLLPPGCAPEWKGLVPDDPLRWRGSNQRPRHRDPCRATGGHRRR